MYPGTKIWDLKPDDGGDPIEVVVANPNEAIVRDPTRYTRIAPDGTVRGDIAKRRREENAKLAEIRKEENARLGEIATERQKKLDAISKEQSDARQKAREKQIEDNKKAAVDAGDVPSREADIQRVEAEAAAEAERVKHEGDEKRRKLALPGALSGPQPVTDYPYGEPLPEAQAAPERPSPPTDKTGPIAAVAPPTPTAASMNPAPTHPGAVETAADRERAERARAERTPLK